MRAHALRNMQGRAQELRCKDEHKSAPTRHLLPPATSSHHTTTPWQTRQVGGRWEGSRTRYLLPLRPPTTSPSHHTPPATSSCTPSLHPLYIMSRYMQARARIHRHRHMVGSTLCFVLERCLSISYYLAYNVYYILYPLSSSIYLYMYIGGMYGCMLVWVRRGSACVCVRRGCR
jgi:hypothetical protein